MASLLLKNSIVKWSGRKCAKIKTKNKKIYPQILPAKSIRNIYPQYLSAIFIRNPQSVPGFSTKPLETCIVREAGYLQGKFFRPTRNENRN